MPTEKLSHGISYTLQRNPSSSTVYALPARPSRLFCNSSLAQLQVSNDPTFASATSITLVNGLATVMGGFIRANLSAQPSPIIRLDPMR